MLTKIFTLLPVAALLAVFTLPGNATLVGTSVTGSLTFSGDPSNYFDPGYGFIPSGTYLNASGTTVQVSANAVEFGYDDGASRITADFSANGLTISDLIEMGGPVNAFQLTFTDPAFAGLGVIPVSDSFPLASSSLSGDVLTLNYAGGNLNAGQTLAADLTIGAVPEPPAFGMLVTSALAALVLVWRQRRAAV